MKIMQLLKNRYVIAYLSVYAILLTLLKIKEDTPIEEILATVFIIGILFTSISYFLSRSATPIFKDRPSQKKELYAVLFMVLYFVLFITFYHELINALKPVIPVDEDQVYEVAKNVAKILFIVIIPLLIYAAVYGFNLKDWGIALNFKAYFSKSSLLIFIAFLIILTLFQYYLGNGARPLREGLYSGRQIALALPLSFIWLLITVGVVEEFFFRTFLQSRFAEILKSDIGGIILSASIFGLAHAPGIYLRGGGLLANLGPDPGFLMSMAYSFLVLSTAGFFLSVIWMKTKNFWLIVAVHASVDLLPNLSSFIDLWGIK